LGLPRAKLNKNAGQNAYDISRTTCEAFPLSKIAHDYGTRADPDAVAEAIAQSYIPAVGRQARAGCLKGLRSSESQGPGETG
jgi:hypothetical protein